MTRNQTRRRYRSADEDLRRTAIRIGLQTALLLSCCLLIVGGIVYATVVHSQNYQVNQMLQAAAAASPDGQDGDHDGDASTSSGGALTAELTDHGLKVSPRVPKGLPDVAVMNQVQSSGVADQRQVELASGTYAVLTVRHGEEVVQAMLNLREQHDERERILDALALASAVGVLLSAVVGAWLARRAVRPLSDALAIQRRFVADASHELRTPLTLLSTRAQLLQRRVAGPRANESEPDRALLAQGLYGIVADTKALADILEELLLAADTREPLPQEPVDVSRLVTETVATAQGEAERRHLRLSRSGDGDASIPAGAPVALKRAIVALVDNALGHARTEVVVDVAVRDRTVVVSVRDDGPGIAPEVVPRMFERFASDRDGSTDAGERRHYGIGLALVSEIATRHGGRVSAHNRPAPDTGAQLDLMLPLG